MTSEQKTRIRELRQNGVSYSTIAEMISLNRETIKSYCRRIGMYTKKPMKGDICRNCGVRIIQNPKARKKVFCSAECRIAWWQKNPYPSLNNAKYTHICPNCGKAFARYSSGATYCSHACYIAARFGDGGHAET